MPSASVTPVGCGMGVASYTNDEDLDRLVAGLQDYFAGAG